jgi:3',5'-cyclic-nucleotide phosphodiesterase
VLRKYWPKMLELRKSMIDMILATDMGLHFDYMCRLDKMKERAFTEDVALANTRTLVCALLLKCADISNVVSWIHLTSPLPVGG